MDLNLTGKNAVVCGSTQGIGRAIAHELAGLGASVTLVARDKAALLDVLSNLPPTSGQKHSFITADFSDPESLRAALGEFAKNKITIEILVNNTGGPKAGPATSARTEEFLAAFTQHLLCNHMLVQAFLPGMKQSGYGRIINIISTSVKQPIPNLGVSNTIRGAVASWAKTLAGELGEFNITVNNVLPGTTKTGRLDSLIRTRADSMGVSIEAVSNEMMAEVPLKRFAEPTEIAAAVAFLASPSAGYINGINLPVDGGRLATL